MFSDVPVGIYTARVISAKKNYDQFEYLEVIFKIIAGTYSDCELPMYIYLLPQNMYKVSKLLMILSGNNDINSITYNDNLELISPDLTKKNCFVSVRKDNINNTLISTVWDIN